MSDNLANALFAEMLGQSTSATTEPNANRDEVCRRLIAGALAVDVSGNITASVSTVPNVSIATGTLPVAHGGTGAGTLTGLVTGNGTSAMTAVTAPAGAVVGTTDAQALTNKTIAGASNTLTVRAASDVTGQLPVVNGGTGLATLTTAYGVITAGTTATGTPQTVTPGAAGTMLRSGGSAAVPTWVANGSPTVFALTDGATPALDASLGTVFTLAAAGDRTIAVPTNATAGQKIVIQHLASGGARTLALNTGAGGFRFGTDITSLTQTASGKTDYIGCIYNLSATFWDVVAVTKGF